MRGLVVFQASATLEIRSARGIAFSLMRTPSCVSTVSSQSTCSIATLARAAEPGAASSTADAGVPATEGATLRTLRPVDRAESTRVSLSSFWYRYFRARARADTCTLRSSTSERSTLSASSALSSSSTSFTMTAATLAPLARILPASRSSSAASMKGRMCDHCVHTALRRGSRATHPACLVANANASRASRTGVAGAAPAASIEQANQSECYPVARCGCRNVTVKEFSSA